MSDSDNIWSIDRLAASALLAMLKVEATTETLDKVAEHFAKHRQCAHEWGAERAHSAAIQILEAASANYFDRKSADWNEGFRAAEAQIIATSPNELLGTHLSKSRSIGQILRTLVSQSKRTSANFPV